MEKNKSDSADLYQISLLIDQLRHDDPQIRANATKNIGSIAKALGPERTRSELIPFINESTDDDDDVLLAIAENIGDIQSHVGGAEFYYTLLEPIELLAIVEDGSVRDAAVKAVIPIVDGMPDDHLLTHFVPFVSKLALKDWFTSRISATALFHIAYSRLPSHVQKEFRALFSRLCADDTPMVRRMAAKHFGDLASRMSAPEIQDELLAPFKKLAVDEQDSVRIQSVGICIALAEALPAELRVGGDIIC